MIKIWSTDSFSFRSITGLKYYIQTGLDTLEVSRKTVVDRLLQIDQTVEEPGEVDIARVGSCRNCQPNGDGASCTLCEMDELFQVWYSASAVCFACGLKF